MVEIKMGRIMKILAIPLIFLVLGLIAYFVPEFAPLIAEIIVGAVFWTFVISIFYLIGGTAAHAITPEGFTNPLYVGFFGSKMGDLPNRLGKYYAMSSLVYVHSWFFLTTPYSLIGGSLFGFILQLIILAPSLLLTYNFLFTENTAGLYILAVANIAIIPLSGFFPTIYSNVFAFVTMGSAQAGAQAGVGAAALSPETYTRRFILHQGTTEPPVGPSAEQVTDEVIRTEVSVGGRMCDSTRIDLEVQLQNLAKYRLENIWVETKSLKNKLPLYGFEDPCRVRFADEACTSRSADIDDYDETYCYFEQENLAKGVPSRPLTTFFTTLLPEDVLTQTCTLRTDVILSYHSTSIFPITFVDYEDYLLYPENIGNPSAINSFGRVRIDMGVGQQPIDDMTSTVTLKVGWGQKEGGIVMNPDIYLFLPPDLVANQTVIVDGEEETFYGCIPFDQEEIESHAVGSAAGWGIEMDVSEYEKIDFECNNNLCAKMNATRSVEAYEDPYMAVSDELSKAKSLNVPGSSDVCEDLVEELNYTVCKSKNAVKPDDILLCKLNLTNVDVMGVKKNTYLVRADSIYDFYDTKITTFSVENCDRGTV